MTTRPFLSLLLVFLLCFSFQDSFAQQPTNNPNEGFKLFFEKVYLHVDRTYYASGDDIWFKAYLVNGQNNHPINTSNNLYVELIDPNAKIISRRVIRLDSAVGIGDFKLDDSVATGAYRIRAYTNWMRNFGNHFIFEKEIQVSNLPGVGKSSVASNTEGKEEVKNKAKTMASPYKIQFFPEGGMMVEDVPTTIAFKAEDANGKGIEARGFIKGITGDTLVSFNTIHAGMGSFAFTPRKGGHYKVMVQFRNNPFTEAVLPTALPDGFVMNVTTVDTSKFVVNINSNKATAKSNPSGNVTITARHAGKSHFKQQVTLNDGKGSVTIPAKDFPAGIAYITLYDDSLRPHCERLVYVEKENILKVNVTSDKQTYQSKEKATVEVSVTDAGNRPVKTNLSVAVVDDKLVKTNVSNIQSYLLLESDLPGKVENPAAYFDKNNNNRLQQIDLLLRAQGWRSFLWRQITDTNLHISYLPEPGITISGTVTKPFSKKTMEGMDITLFAPDARGDKIYTTRTDAKGKYYLDGLPLFGVQTVKLNVGDAIGKKPGSINMDSVNNNILPVARNPNYTFDTSAAMTAFTNEANRRYSIFRNDNVLPGVKVTARSKTILEDGSMVTSFGYPEYDFDITNKDYQYQSLRDFLVQKVPGARYDDNLEGVEFLSNGKPIRPIFIIDNREDRFGRMDYYSLAMQQVESVRVRHNVGSRPHSGFVDDGEGGLSTEAPGGIKDYFLINLKIKPGNADQQLSKIITNVTGYYESRIFYAPNYATEEASQKDERITIHWAPLMKTGDDGKARISFYNADPKDKIRISVEGLTVDGTPIVASGFYDVR